MDVNMELENQYKRFSDETSAIKSQVEFIEESLILPAVMEKRNKLTYSLIPNFKSIEEVHAQLDVTIKQLSDSIIELKESLSDIYYQNLPERFASIDYRSEEGELIQFILEIIGNGESDPQKIVEEVNIQLEALSIIEGENMGGGFYLELYDNTDRLIEYIDLCLKINHNNKIQDIEDSISILNHHIKLLSLVNTKNSTNIYRQAFIQLIAIFDTIVFECFRIKFNLNFFEWLKYFKDSTIKYSEISRCMSFEAFQQQTIEEKLRSCYIKDLLIIARNQDKSTFLMNGTDMYPYFREIINRRNCHIHNNGIVDNAYLGVGNSSVEVFNIYNMEIGEYLSIDKTYFYNALEMCRNFLYNFIRNK